MGKFKCTGFGCKSSFVSEKLLRSHQRNFHSGSVTCDICLKNFRTKYTLSKHRKVAHASHVRTYKTIKSSPVGPSSRIKKEFHGIYEFNGGADEIDYGCYILKMRAKGKVAVAGFQSLRFGDFHGRGKPPVGSFKAVFNYDRGLSKDLQANRLQYEKTGYDRGHVCPAGDYQKNIDDCFKTYAYPNCIPTTPFLNRNSVYRMESAVRGVVRDSGAALVITCNVFPEVGIRYLDANKTIAIPDFIGKIIMDRDIAGCHILGLRSTYNNLVQTTEKKKAVHKPPLPYYDPFQLLREAGIKLKIDARNFKTINDVENAMFDAATLATSPIQICQPHIDLLSLVNNENKEEE